MTDGTGGFGPRTLGSTGLSVGPLGISASYGVPAGAVERAFEAGMNYLYWGTMRRAAFANALRRLAPQREHMVLVLQSYSPFGWGIVRAVERGLRQLGLGHADVLLLGYWNRPVPGRILDVCQRLKERGLIRFTAVSSHKRALFPVLAKTGGIDVFHVRYNAAHRGAETEVFPHLPAAHRPGIAAFTATSWGRLLRPALVPPGERVPTAGDCYRFVLSHAAVDLCVTGPATREHVEHALAAVARGPMDPEELAWMRRVGDAVYGRRRRAG